MNLQQTKELLMNFKLTQELLMDLQHVKEPLMELQRTKELLLDMSNPNNTCWLTAFGQAWLQHNKPRAHKLWLLSRQFPAAKVLVTWDCCVLINPVYDHPGSVVFSNGTIIKL